MAFRGYFALNGVELSNSARVAAHLGVSPPTVDSMVWGSDDCGLIPVPGQPGLFQIPASSAMVSAGLYSPPDGSSRHDPGLIEVGECWRPSSLCVDCRRPTVLFDDSWTGLQEFLGDTVYRPELAPWFQNDVPESAEFGGVWVLDVNGLGPVPISRPITELVGAGAAAGRHRDMSRPVTFTALLVACTNAGLEYGLAWLDCQLRETKDRADAVLRYLMAHPDGSAADATDLRRELHGVVLTKSVTVEAEAGPRRHATMCRVTWEVTALHPYSYAPPITIPVMFDRVELQPIEWVHGAGCDIPGTCDPMPILFNADCVPETIDIVSTPPPTCGGCLPVCGVLTCVFILDGPQPPPVYEGSITVPVDPGELFDEVPYDVPFEIAPPPSPPVGPPPTPPGIDVGSPTACRPTAVSWTITNNGSRALTAQTYWRACSADVECGDTLWPAQITGLPAASTLTFDAVRARYWVTYLAQPQREYRPVGVVSTPSGSPWEPAVLDRSTCWEFVVLTPDGSDFDVTLSLFDRVS